LLQDETYDLTDILLKRGYIICLETNGSISLEKIADKKSLMISLDIKCPSSGMHEKMNLNNLSHLTAYDQLKFVIGNRIDYEYATVIIRKYNPKATVFFQPVWGANLKELSSWILDDDLNVRLGLQLHKIIWGDKREI
ncbi:MAG: 7-carboxy-7-deazaguanine synthase QueE, partial [Thermoplasmatales archaeon]